MPLIKQTNHTPDGVRAMWRYVRVI